MSEKRASKRSAIEAPTEHQWIADIQGALSVGAIADFLKLWGLLSGVQLQAGVMDKHLRLSSSGQYIAKSAYAALFQGAVSFGPWERIWKSRSPANCRFFIWLVAHNHYWRADWLAQRGLLHTESCPLCNQEQETTRHLLVTCLRCPPVLVRYPFNSDHGDFF